MKIQITKSILALLLLIGVYANANAQQQLSETAQISVLTCSPGEEIYTTFGHTAIRVQDPILGIDQVFNYGTFNFDTPNFTMQFLRGKLLYKLGLANYDRFMRMYSRSQRAVREQVLDLNPEQRQAVYAELMIERLPENRFYKYDFFFDNCATRVRDVFERSLGKNLTWGKNEKVEGRTLRQLLDDHVSKDLPWIDLGMDLILGASSDVKANTSNAMYLPYHLEYSLASTQLSSNGKPKDFVSQTNILLDYPQSSSNSILSYLPLLLFGFLLVLRLLFYKSTGLHKLDGVVLFLFALMGIIMLIMWFATDHLACHWNWNVLWASPLLFVLAIQVFRKAACSSLLATIQIFLCLAVFVFFLVSWQIFHGVTLLFALYVLFMMLRYGSISLPRAMLR
ncbi:DUF4105 domain-containing protein [Chitinophagales bacterium]|nr:DUF4105 domain-containing protein [Chitinophagales bacterium]